MLQNIGILPQEYKKQNETLKSSSYHFLLMLGQWNELSNSL